MKKSKGKMKKGKKKFNAGSFEKARRNYFGMGKKA